MPHKTLCELLWKFITFCAQHYEETKFWPYTISCLGITICHSDDKIWDFFWYQISIVHLVIWDKAVNLVTLRNALDRKHAITHAINPSRNQDKGTKFGPRLGQSSPLKKGIQLQHLETPTDQHIPVADDGRRYLPKDLLQFGG